jgi:hypothetical protein
MGRPKLERPCIYPKGTERLDTLVHLAMAALERKNLHKASFQIAARFAKLQEEQWKPQILALVGEYVDIKENGHDG